MQIDLTQKELQILLDKLNTNPTRESVTLKTKLLSYTEEE